jgi:hypothetical protein
MTDHSFCRVMLSDARAAAKEKGVELPRKITALRSTERVFFVESEGQPGEFVKGCCSYHAKARFIVSLVDAAEGSNQNNTAHGRRTTNEASN